MLKRKLIEIVTALDEEQDREILNKIDAYIERLLFKGQEAEAGE